MDIIRPVVVTDAVLDSSNVPENDYAEWNVATAYTVGNRVILLSTHRIYEAVGSSTGVNPATDDGTNWLNIGATNRWKAFDQKISDPVTQVDSISYTFTPTGSTTTAVALFGLRGVSARVEVTTPNRLLVQAGDLLLTEDSFGIDYFGPVYDVTKSLLDNSSVFDWDSYFFEEITFVSTMLFTDIPPYLGATVKVTVTQDTGETTELGQLVFGYLTELGVTTYGTAISIQDFSRKETDAFGNFIIVERAFANLVDYDVRLPTQTAGRVRRILAEYRATPIVYIGNEDSSFGTITYGFYRNFDITLDTPSLSFAAIEVEGIT
jgi:hypothetical protein